MKLSAQLTWRKRLTRCVVTLCSETIPEWRVVKVSEHIERLVQLIKGAEGPETTGEIGLTVASVEEHEDSDDEDNQIEEV